MGIKIYIKKAVPGYGSDGGSESDELEVEPKGESIRSSIVDAKGTWDEESAKGGRDDR